MMRQSRAGIRGIIGICTAPMFWGMRRVSFSTSTNTAILTTSMGVEIALDRLFGAYRAMIGGR